MCAAVSSYVYACSAAGIEISGWRVTICGESTTHIFFSVLIQTADHIEQQQIQIQTKGMISLFTAAVNDSLMIKQST